MFQIISKDSLAKRKPTAKFSSSTNLKELMRTKSAGNGQTLVEITRADFGRAWYERQRYELAAGMAEEPRLYEPLYNIISDASLPKNVTVNRLGPGGVIFDEIKEGGEVHFATVGESEVSVGIKHYAVGLEYTKDLIMYNELWNVGIIERAAGIAYNALLNHIHLSPILTASYAAKNITDAGDLTFGTDATYEEQVFRTFEQAMIDAAEDETDTREGPYILLTAPGNRFTLERAFRRVPQQGFEIQSSAMNAIQSVITYNGWTGSRGKKTVTYTGVEAGTMYLIDMSKRTENFQSFFKQDLQSQAGESDMSRFILEQVIWDAYFGVYANPTAAVQKIVLPTVS